MAECATGGGQDAGTRHDEIAMVAATADNHLNS